MTWSLAPRDARVVRKMPPQKPSESKQDYGTPMEFIRACERRFGKLEVDLAATKENKKAPIFIPRAMDSLSVPWSKLYGNNTCWLNPPFSRIGPWAEKCLFETTRKRWGDGQILFLTPASVGTNWYWDNIHDHALVLQLRPRLVFEGEKDPYPKDLMLSRFEKGGRVGFERWSWKEGD